MKLKTFNNTNTFLSNNRISPVININQSNGLVGISQGACEQIGVAAGDQVVFHQDEESPMDWYIQKVKEGGIVLKPKTKGCSIHRKALALEIMKTLEIKKQAITLLLAGKPVELEKKEKMWGLLVTGLKDM